MSKASPCHWKSAVDPRTGRTYYYHEITRETQWRKPMELASESERRLMEEKERKQKDFFAAMEANILNSLSQGVVPGTPKEPSVARRKSSRRAPTKVGRGGEDDGDMRPELIRTISTMDETALRDIIRRQPSFRTVKKTDSLQLSDLQPNRKGSEIRGKFESFVSIKDDKERLDPLQESGMIGNDSMPDLFSYLPDDASLGDSISEMNSIRSDGGKFNESSITGFGLTWEETQALKKLASLTKEMIDVEKEEDEDIDGGIKLGAGATPSWKFKDNKGMRDLPREIEFSDDSESELEPTPNQGRPNSGGAAAPNFQKAKDIGGRELDFEDSDSETDPGSARGPSPAKLKSVRISEAKRSPKSNGLDDKRPEVKRRNTCGTLYVGTTMSAPDKDATIKCVCGVYRTHILSSRSDTLYDPELDEFRVFNDLETEQGQHHFKFHNNMQPSMPVPSLDAVTDFYRGVFYKAQMEADCIIMSLIYVERLIKRTNGALRPRPSNWRSLIFSCMILSSKVWDDLSMWNADFSQSCPPGVSFPLKRINQLELAVLNALGFQVKVPASEYAKYYFLLRSMLIKSGLGGDDINALDPLDVMGARRLQQMSSQFESLSLSKANKNPARSKSLNVDQIPKGVSQGKVGLEHVVKM